MAFRNYLEEEDDKPYFTTNSLGYYYDKMEGFAEKVEQAAKTLNVTKEEVEKNVAAYIEQNKTELDQRLAQWDEKLGKFDSSVETLLSEWVDDGTLTHVIDSTLIDQKIAPVAAQLTEIPQIHVSSGAPPDNSIGKDGDLFFIALSPKSYYLLGNEVIKWVEGASVGVGSIAKESENLLIEGTGVGSLRTYVTDTLVNLSDVNTLFIEWENVGFEDGNGVSSVQTKLNISTDKAGDQTVHNLRFSPSTSSFGDGVFAKQITSCDVTSLTGSYYIRVHARSNGASAISRLKVYRVWGE